MDEYVVRVTYLNDRRWISQLLKKYWGSTEVVTRGRIHRADRLPGFAAFDSNKPVGLVTYRIEGADCEIVTLNSLVEGAGIGSELLSAVRRVAEKSRCRRLWLITTNDNKSAIEFYKRRGFTVAAVHRDAIKESRRLKPEIPQIGVDGIPFRDEIEMEIDL
jgi:ribosomal protein S18 acetylase RimI-like enzyme